MTRKDYELIAHVLQGCNSITPEQRKDLAQVYVTVLKAKNPRFKADVFLKACGVEV